MISQYFEDARKRYKISRENPQFWAFPKQGFGYIQIPKAATRSIREALMVVEAVDSENFVGFEEAFSRHLPTQKIREAAAGLAVFAFVRDPLARLYSAYVNKLVDAQRLERKNIFRCHGMDFGMPFESFVQRVCELDDRHIDRHLRSQAWFLTDKQGLIPSFIGHLETFADDWNRLCEQIPSLGVIGHRNKASGVSDFRSYYTDGALEQVYRRYAQDFQLFGYEPR